MKCSLSQVDLGVFCGVRKVSVSKKTRKLPFRFCVKKPNCLEENNPCEQADKWINDYLFLNWNVAISVDTWFMRINYAVVFP